MMLIRTRCVSENGQDRCTLIAPALLGDIAIPDAFRDWAIACLRRTHQHETESRTRLYKSQQSAYNAVQRQLDRLMDLHLIITADIPIKITIRNMAIDSDSSEK